MREIRYISTRGCAERVSASAAIVRGIAPDGGLYVPEDFPCMDRSLHELQQMSYQELAYEVMKLFLTDYSREELMDCVIRAYDSKFDDPAIAPLVHPGDRHVLELYHGRTLAFKDMALSILPYLMTTAASKQHITEEIVILTATSGDTGKAALEGFANVPGVRIIVFYPQEGVSDIQRLQMVTQQGDNTAVIAMQGNFDDAQRVVKEIFTDPEEARKMREAGYVWSSANSINIGRLIPQIVYYYWAYLRMTDRPGFMLGEQVDFAVPTGNFGNILAAHYAGRLGLPVGRLICASNRNHVLTDFFRTGEYDAKRPFYVTTSPSMDILVSSNLERLLYEICGRDTGKVASLLAALSSEGQYRLDKGDFMALDGFWAGYAEEDAVADTIRRVYRESGYVMDPHTAVAAAVADQYETVRADEGRRSNPLVIISTASPYKFPQSVLGALGKPEPYTAEALSAASGRPVPQPIRELFSLPVRHTRVCTRENALKEIYQVLGL